MQMQINNRYVKIFDNLKKYNYIYGGSSSAKTYSIVQYLVLCMLQGEAVMVMRNTQSSIKKTIINDFRDVIANSELSDYFDITKSFPLRITSKIGTGECLFLGADKNADDDKGVKPSNGGGKFTVFFADECDQIPKGAILQMRLRVRGKSSTGSKVRFIYSFNPTFRNHYLFDDFICPTGFDPYKDWDWETDNTTISRMTYRDNAFLDQDDVDTLEETGEASPYYKQVYLNAEPGVLGDRCINGYEVITLAEVPINGVVDLGGIDHGWHHPFAGIWGVYDSTNKTLYITNELVGSELGLNFIADNLPHNIPFTGDSEDPRSNSTLKSNGVLVKNAKKGPGSVFGGIQWLNTITIKVVDSCTNVKTALDNYSWKVDPISGKSIDKPDHAFSDCVDAIRYMMERYSRGSSNMQFGSR